VTTFATGNHNQLNGWKKFESCFGNSNPEVAKNRYKRFCADLNYPQKIGMFLLGSFGVKGFLTG